MTTPPHTRPTRAAGASHAETPRRRADAERSVARILDAAVDVLSGDPGASMSEIARRAGVVRATVYVHFPTREALIDAVTERALAEVGAAIDAAEPQRGDPAEALARVVGASWHALRRYHALVALNTAQHAHGELRDRHAAVLARLASLIERGQADGRFRADVPPSWHLSALMALVHAASGEAHAGHLPAADVEPVLIATTLGALGAGDR